MVSALGELTAEKHVNQGDESVMEGTREASWKRWHPGRVLNDK